MEQLAVWVCVNKCGDDIGCDKPNANGIDIFDDKCREKQHQ